MAAEPWPRTIRGGIPRERDRRAVASDVRMITGVDRILRKSLAPTGKAAKAVDLLTSGGAEYRSTGGRVLRGVNRRRTLTPDESAASP